MKRGDEETGQRNPQRPGRAVLQTLAGLCLGFGMYGMIHGLKSDEGTLLPVPASIMLCGGILLLRHNLRTRKTEEKENR